MFHWLEKNPFFFVLLVIGMISFAGLIELIPSFMKNSRPVVGVKPYSVLELAGRQIYIKESCNACHSQQIRPFKSETDRYGMYSLSGEYAYDRPFLWGSKRTGPDLMRVGNVKTTDWHENHMWEPKELVPGTVMPSYKHMYTKLTDLDTAYAEAYTVKKVFGVPYNEKDMPSIGNSLEESKVIAMSQAKEIVKEMKKENIKEMIKEGKIPEIVALIAYLNSLK